MNEEHYFDQRVYKNVPKMITFLSISFFIIGMIGALLIDEPNNIVEKK